MANNIKSFLKSFENSIVKSLNNFTEIFEKTNKLEKEFKIMLNKRKKIKENLKEWSNLNES